MDEPATLICDVIQNEMALGNDRVKQYNQDYKKPKDQALFVVVSLGTIKLISSVNRFEPADAEADPPTVDREVKSVTQAERYNIEITSRDDSAMLRQHEVIMALTSTYSIQQQEKNGVRLVRSGEIQDLSFIDGGSSLYRYQIPVTIFNVRTKETPITTIDKFPAPVTAAE